MLSSRVFFVPFGLQMICMAFDEFHFHRRRDLPRWERIGHPLDTLTVLVCLLWLVLVPPSPATISIYVTLAVFSCLFVTKDEGVHLKLCGEAEQRLHALLFTLHPLVLLGAGMLWPGSLGFGCGEWIRCSGEERRFLIGVCVAVFGFGLFQFVYWNLPWRIQKAVK